jgi:hypothetical protein
MSLELIEKFLVELTPPSAHIPLHNVIDVMKREPIEAMGQGFHFLSPDIKNEGSPESAAAVNGILLGVCLAYGIQRSPRMVSLLEEYIDYHQKNRGTNVVDFASARIKK